MLNWILRKIIGTKNQRQIKKLWPLVHEINRIEQRLQSETDEALSARTAKWQEQFKAFHPPLFLAGVSLRIADEPQVDECLVGLADKFGRLREHFPTLDQELVAEAAWKNEPLDAKKDRILRQSGGHRHIQHGGYRAVGCG